MSERSCGSVSEPVSDKVSDTVRFGVFADCQYADADRGTTQRHYRESLAKLRAAVQVFNRSDLDFVVNLGDLVDRHSRDAPAVHKVLAECAAPVVHLLGNHDLLATGGDLPAALHMLGLSRPFHGFALRGLRLLLLDTTEDSVLVHPPGSAAWTRRLEHLTALADAGQVNARRWNGAVGAAQLDWLRRELAEAERAGERVLVCLHSPLAPLNEHTTLNAAEVLATLDSAGAVRAVFAGHHHRGSFVVRSGVPHLTFQGMVQTPENAFAIVTVRGDELVVEGHGREPSRTLTSDAGPIGQVDEPRRG